MIQTTFTNNGDVRVITYTPNGDYFTWPSSKGEPISTNGNL